MPQKPEFFKSKLKNFHFFVIFSTKKLKIFHFLLKKFNIFHSKIEDIVFTNILQQISRL